MSTTSLEDRVVALEGQMAQLLLRPRLDQPKDWRRTLGMFTGDAIMWRICQNAIDYRDEDRRQSLAEFDEQQGEQQ